MNISQTQHMRTSSLAVLWLVWLAATSVGMIVGGLVAFPLGWSIGETAEQALGQVPALLVVGLVMGGVLFARAAWWVLVSAASLGLTLAVLFGISAEGRELVSLLLSGVIYGAIAGAGMAWLLRDANKVNG